ncbi:MAG: hypothetical protein IJA23_00455 [Clostridia bacterium]|nr:hypothetical protein [Clostridia bacterium]
MIALNELIKDIEKYKTAYKLMGIKTNLNVFVALENKLRIAGQNFEHSRSTCNKKCGELIKKQSNNIDTKTELAEIEKLDKQTLKLQSRFNKINKRVNRKLNKLPNLPDEDNVTHLQIETSKTTLTIENLISFIEKLSKVNSSNQKLSSFLKGETDKIYAEENLPQATLCKDGILIFTKKDAVSDIFEQLLNHFKENSISIIKQSIKTLKSSSSKECLIHLNNNLYLKLELKREFFSRKYKIKYHDNKTDMTKFVNQIDIKF